ncbi:MAG: MBOAT family protein [Flavobacteriales bacterium]|nr:MBOAT family protein [Flavobacteriales bacterium]
MIFNEPVFVAFLVIVFALYWLPFTRNGAHKHPVLLAASYVFYGWWDWRYLGLIIFCSLVAFYCGLAIHRAANERQRKGYLLFSIVVPLAVLVVFKYYDFFVYSLLELGQDLGLTLHLHTLQVLLPVGISFYTFQALSYTTDIYRREIKPTDQLVTFLAFKAFFPQLVAGPIERAPHFLPQIEARRPFSYANAVHGCRLMLTGAFKKMVVADRLAPLVDDIFSQQETFGGLFNLVGVVFFALQIYCDFSGYSDIARGVAKLFNLDLVVNFDRPYAARSLREFWSRWHISLSTWFRDYVYIPLGGNRNGWARHVRNLLITFLLSGLWHGANWTFVFWGALHGGFLIVERLAKGGLGRLPGAMQWAITMVVVLVGWVFFRADNIGHAWAYLGRMMEHGPDLIHQLHRLTRPNEISPLSVLLSGLFGFAVLVAERLTARPGFSAWFEQRPVVRRLSYASLVALVLLFGVFADQSAFIYFQF